MKHTFFATVFLTCFYACTTGENKKADESAKFIVRYQCEEGQVITVEYDNSDPEKSTASVQLSPENPERVLLTISMSASGARYTDGKLVWWTKGKTAFLSEEGQADTTIYGDCHEFEETSPDSSGAVRH